MGQLCFMWKYSTQGATLILAHSVNSASLLLLKFPLARDHYISHQSSLLLNISIFDLCYSGTFTISHGSGLNGGPKNDVSTSSLKLVNVSLFGKVFFADIRTLRWHILDYPSGALNPMTRMLIRYRRDSDKDRKRRYVTSGRDWSYPAPRQGMPMDQKGFSLRAFGGNGLGDNLILNFWPLEQ